MFCKSDIKLNTLSMTIINCYLIYKNRKIILTWECNSTYQFCNE